MRNARFSIVSDRSNGWATAYNLLAIPVAGGLFVRWGFDRPMSVGAVAMSLSTSIVTIDAQWLRHLQRQREVANPEAIGLSDAHGKIA